MGSKPHFVINNISQQYLSGRGGVLFNTIITPQILGDLCARITGKSEYTHEFVEKINIGRMAILYHNDAVSYISFSSHKNDGRNSDFQSVAYPLYRYFMEKNPRKNIYFHFIPSTGENETDYHMFMYRTLLTAGINILNGNEYLSKPLNPFYTADDMIANRELIRGNNRSNNSTYMTTGRNHHIQIYAKTYGANKYESALLCVALRNITDKNIEFFNIREKNLKQLPEKWVDYLNSQEGVDVHTSDVTMERKIFEEKYLKLRSPSFILNMLIKLGPKKCALCGCELPELIQGAHVWSIASIKISEKSIGEKIKYATDGDNGIWLCENHHTMFDEGIVAIDKNGEVRINPSLSKNNSKFVDWSTPIKKLEPRILTKKFMNYLDMRYGLLA